MTDHKRLPNLALVLLLVGAAALPAQGCGKSKVERHNLSGTVTFQGKPVPVGLIIFEPDVTRGNRGPQGYAEILNGRYQTDKIGKGSVTGPLAIEITGYPPADGSGGNPDVPLFASYTTTADVTEDTTTLDFEVPSKR